MKKVLTAFKKLQKVLGSLKKVYLEVVDKDQVIIDATIQRFRFTTELFWKFLQEYFRTKEVYIDYPKDVLKQAYASRIINDEKMWIQIFEDKKLIPYTYNEELAHQIFKRIQRYVPEIQSTVDKIKKELLPEIKLENHEPEGR
ncbi:nucleotidyltransferase substrate binding protein [Candidatus Babeliales bacterium]|nr:nucleotidyltransferase substrate binding protein [Candidatus Babeliales bacterium]